ncbi:MAG: TIGR03905 family TSCPD domain-containing protein [Oscillospiraceae bacterium]|nr:TIGR03905 family TSCPD domain-containing protein [Oscillospiraceae bacterium]
MKTIHYQPQGVCPAQISFDLDGDVVRNVKFHGGCPGNLKAISKVVEGWTVGQIEEMFRGNTCGMRPTSCVDQLSRAVRAAYEENA